MKKIFIKRILAGMVTALGMTGVAVQAVEQLEEIVVTGIKASVKQALDIKRENTNFVDAISAEDVGKLPDRNIAEALQRVPGVAIQRERGEGDFVSIRGLGPEFVRGTVNGRTLTSGTESFDSTLNGAEANTTGRETNFDVLPSEIINTLEVYKTSSADQVEGGIGGVVNIKTARPVVTGNTAAFTLRGQYNEFSEETDPSFSGVRSWANDEGTLGILGSVSYSERSIREDLANSFGYGNFFGDVDTDGDGAADVTAPFIPFSANPEIFLEDRERITMNTSFQWLPSEDTKVVLDAQWSEREVTSDQYGTIVSIGPGSFPGTAPCVAVPGTSTVTNSDGSLNCSGAVAQSGTIVSIPGAFDVTNFTDVRSGKDTIVNIGLNVSHNAGNWQLSGDLSYADAQGDLDFTRVVSAFVNDDLGQRDVPGVADTLSGAVRVVPAALSSDSSNPANYSIRQTEVRIRDNNDEELAFKFDARYIQTNSSISSIKLGVRYRTREKSFAEMTGNDNATSGTGNIINASTIPNSLIGTPNNFLDGFTGLSPSNLLFPNLSAILPVRGDAVVVVNNTLGGFNTEEDTLAGYIQINLDTKVGGLPLAGNAGVRIVRTETNVVGQSQAFTIDETSPGSGVNQVNFSGPVVDVPFDESYTNFLPSMNLRLDINDDLLARFAYGRTLTRPEFEQLAPSLNVTNPTQLQASAGNPGLEPYLSDNLDLSLEWYFNEASALTASIFYKRIEDFIVGFTNQNVAFQGTTFTSLSQPDNQGKADITGFELGYTHSLTSLPEPFDGLGLIFNLTGVDSNLELNNGTELSFPGVSDISYNAALFYDKGAVQARLAYTYRDEFLSDASNVFGNQTTSEEYDQLDFSASYAVSDNVTAFLEIVNLTDEQEQLFVSDVASPGNGTRPLSLGQVGRRVGFGVSAKF